MNKLKLVLLLLGVIPLYGILHAQEEEPDTLKKPCKFMFGGKAGVAFSAFTINREPFTEAKAGLMITGFVEYPVSGFLSLSLEPGYVQKGARHVSPSFFYDESTYLEPYSLVELTSITTHHVQLPLLAKFKLPGNSCCTAPFLTVGGSVTYNFYAEARELVDYGTINNQMYYRFIDEIVTDKFESWEYQVVAGAGVEFEYPFGDIIGSLNYCLGLSQVNKFSYQNQLYNFSSNSWMISLGYRFKKKEKQE